MSADVAALCSHHKAYACVDALGTTGSHYWDPTKGGPEYIATGGGDCTGEFGGSACCNHRDMTAFKCGPGRTASYSHADGADCGGAGMVYCKCDPPPEGAPPAKEVE